MLPAIIGALIVLLTGWIAGRLLGKAVRFVIDKAMAAVSATPVIGDSEIDKPVEKASTTPHPMDA